MIAVIATLLRSFSMSCLSPSAQLVSHVSWRTNSLTMSAVVCVPLFSKYPPSARCPLPEMYPMGLKYGKRAELCASVAARAGPAISNS